jgi:hypothetical protein
MATAPSVQNIMDLIEIVFTIKKVMSESTNVSILRKQFISFAKQMDPDFCIDPLKGDTQSISIPNNIPATKEGVELYFHHSAVKDAIPEKTQCYYGDANERPQGHYHTL